MTQKEMTAQLKKKISLEITQISKSYKGFKCLPRVAQTKVQCTNNTWNRRTSPFRN